MLHSCKILHMNYFFALITTLPSDNATARMRIWRSLKKSGAAILRDGVYLLPQEDQYKHILDELASEVISLNGSAHVVLIEEPATGQFKQLFDRSAEFSELCAEARLILKILTVESSAGLLKRIMKCKKTFEHLVAIDFFPSESQKQAKQVQDELQAAIARILSPDEPQTIESDIPTLSISEYQNRIWVTRARPWADRLACAWLIRRFIDPQAKILWLTSFNNDPKEVVGFDFDGAAFTHVGAYVTFEVMLVSFKLENEPLKKIGSIIHFIDVGGIQPIEAAGIQTVLAGLRDSIHDDDKLLDAASHVFDGLFASYQKAQNHE